MGSWREDAINWIHRHASNLDETPLSKWHVGRPSLEARVHALHIIRYVPADFSPPAELSVTLDRGIELEWYHGEKELTIDIRANGSLEIIKSCAGETVEERVLPKPDWRLGSYFDWLVA